MFLFKEFLLPITSSIIVGLMIVSIIWRLTTDSLTKRIQYLDMGKKLVLVIGFLVLIISLIFVSLEDYGITVTALALFISTILVTLELIQRRLMSRSHAQVELTDEKFAVLNAIFENYAEKSRKGDSEE